MHSKHNLQKYIYRPAAGLLGSMRMRSGGCPAGPVLRKQGRPPSAVEFTTVLQCSRQRTFTAVPSYCSSTERHRHHIAQLLFSALLQCSLNTMAWHSYHAPIERQFQPCTSPVILKIINYCTALHCSLVRLKNVLNGTALRMCARGLTKTVESHYKLMYTNNWINTYFELGGMVQHENAGQVRSGHGIFVIITWSIIIRELSNRFCIRLFRFKNRNRNCQQKICSLV